MNPTEIKNSLAQFHGSETFTRWSFSRRDVLTEGALFVAKECGAFWLMDAIASHQHKLKNEDFQVWRLRKENEKWVLTGEDGNYREIIEQKIKFSDFPLDEIKLFACRNELGGITIMLPGEY